MKDPAKLSKYFAYMFVDKDKIDKLPRQGSSFFVRIGMSHNLVRAVSSNDVVPIGFGLEDTLESVLKKVLDGALYRPFDFDGARGLKTTNEQEIVIPVYAEKDAEKDLSDQWEEGKEIVVIHDPIKGRSVRFLLLKGTDVLPCEEYTDFSTRLLAMHGIKKYSCIKDVVLKSGDDTVIAVWQDEPLFFSDSKDKLVERLSKSESQNIEFFVMGIAKWYELKTRMKMFSIERLV